MSSPFTTVTSSYGGSGFASGAAHFPDSPVPAMPASRRSKSGGLCPFDLTVKDKKLTVTDGVVYVGSNKEISVEGISVAEQFTGDVFLKISWSSSGTFGGQLVTTNPGTPGASDNFVSRKLYSFENGKVKMDYRLTPVFVLYN